MNRLSGRNKYGMAYTKIPLNKSYIECETKQPEICYTGFIADRLAAYEDTGFAPDEIPHWISVSERLPEKTGRYLVLSKMNWAYGGTWDGNDGDISRNMALAYFSGATEFNIPYVTYWMELPAAPKEVGATI